MLASSTISALYQITHADDNIYGLAVLKLCIRSRLGIYDNAPGNSRADDIVYDADLIREENDFYATDPIAVTRLLDVEKFSAKLNGINLEKH